MIRMRMMLIALILSSWSLAVVFSLRLFLTPSIRSTKYLPALSLFSGPLGGLFAKATPSTGILLIDAVIERDESKVFAILSEPTTDKNSCDPSTGNNALHFVAKRGHYRYPPDGIPSALIKAGVDMNSRNLENQTPLEISLLSGWQKIAMLLLDNGADRSVVTEDVKRKITCPDCKRVVKQYNL